MFKLLVRNMIKKDQNCMISTLSIRSIKRARKNEGGNMKTYFKEWEMNLNKNEEKFV